MLTGLAFALKKPPLRKHNNNLTLINKDSSNLPDPGTSTPTISTPFYLRNNGHFFLYNYLEGDNYSEQNTHLLNLKTGKNKIVSSSNLGEKANRDSRVGTISKDEKYLFFTSTATNLTDSTPPYGENIFKKNLLDGKLEMYTLKTGYNHLYTSIKQVSDNGKLILATTANNEKTNLEELYLLNTDNGNTTRIDTDSVSNPGNGSTWDAAISSNNQFVVFRSNSTNLVNNDTNGVDDIFMKNLSTNQTSIISTNSSGDQANSYSSDPKITSDNRYILFESSASNLIPGGFKGSNIYRKDLQTGGIIAILNRKEAKKVGTKLYRITPNGSHILVYDPNYSPPKKTYRFMVLKNVKNKKSKIMDLLGISVFAFTTDNKYLMIEGTNKTPLTNKKSGIFRLRLKI